MFWVWARLPGCSAVRGRTDLLRDPGQLDLPQSPAETETQNGKIRKENAEKQPSKKGGATYVLVVLQGSIEVGNGAGEMRRG